MSLKHIIAVALCSTLVGCAKKNPPLLRLSQDASVPSECQGVKARGELSTEEFKNLINCLNSKGGLSEIVPLLIGKVESAERSTKLYNQIFSKRISIKPFEGELKRLTSSYNTFQDQTASLNRVLDEEYSEVIEILGKYFSNKDDNGEFKEKYFLSKVQRVLGNLSFIQLVKGFFYNDSPSEKKAFFLSLSEMFGKTEEHLDKWNDFRLWWNDFKDSNEYHPIRAPESGSSQNLNLLSQKGALSALHAVTKGLSIDELHFLKSFVSYQLNPIFRSSTFVEGPIHEEWIKDRESFETDEKDHIKKNILDLGKHFPRTNFSALVQLLIAADRPIRGVDKDDDLLLNSTKLLTSIYSISLITLDNPRKIDWKNPPPFAEQKYGPDNKHANLFRKVIQFLYTIRETEELVKSNENQSDLFSILEPKLVGTPPKVSLYDYNIADPEFLIQLYLNSPDQFEELKGELLALYDYYYEGNGGYLSDVILNYLKGYPIAGLHKKRKNKVLVNLFRKEVTALLPEKPKKPEIQEMMKTVITLRKLIPLLESIRADLKTHSEVLTEPQTWLEGGTLISVTKRFLSAPSLSREIFKSIGEMDQEALYSNIKLAFKEFLIPRVLEPFKSFDELLRTKATPLRPHSNLVEFSENIYQFNEDVSISSLYFMDLLIKNFQSQHQFFFGTEDYAPWGEMSIDERIDALLTFTVPMLQIPSKLDAIDPAIDLLYSLHTAQSHHGTDHEKYELVNYWAENLLSLPSQISLIASFPPEVVSHVDQFIEDLTTIDNVQEDSLFEELTDTLDRFSGLYVDGDDQFPAIAREEIGPWLHALLSDDLILETWSNLDQVPFEVRLSLWAFNSSDRYELLLPSFQNRKVLHDAIIFFHHQLNDRNGVYSALRLYRRLSSNSFEILDSSESVVLD